MSRCRPQQPSPPFYLIISFNLEALLWETLVLLFTVQHTMEEMKYCHIPAFGDWDFSDGVPITQYFDSARNFFVEDKDLFPVPVQIIPAYAYHHQIKVIKNVKSESEEKKQKKKKKKQQQRKACDLVTQKPRKHSAPKIEEEDLYRISPELLYQKSKRKKFAKGFWFGCMGCIH
ncbi:hypothetical protein IHE45_10G033600 [Dioscorea alata]|uniref:Uncharacterized protein n=1 Tax=Dioscorea alata TaxID=55571 RepID=A0ACB7VAB9_DIOAL|nr:hypothetical protein IHE45_10G033600 [Dioscorea alata]